MKLKAKTSSGLPLAQSKRIYLDSIEIHSVCPECKSVDIHDNRIPILTGKSEDTWYCHHFYCHECHFESKKPLYTLNSIGEDSIDITFNTDIKVTAFELVVTKKEILS